jgi:hypothetical protein
MRDSFCTRQRARSSTFIVCESLFPIRSHGEYYLQVPRRVSVETTSRSAPHYPRWHPCKSQPAKSKSQPVNTKVSRIIVLPKRLCRQACVQGVFYTLYALQTPRRLLPYPRYPHWPRWLHRLPLGSSIEKKMLSIIHDTPN